MMLVLSGEGVVVSGVRHEGKWRECCWAFSRVVGAAKVRVVVEVSVSVLRMVASLPGMVVAAKIVGGAAATEASGLPVEEVEVRVVVKRSGGTAKRPGPSPHSRQPRHRRGP